MWYLWSSWYLLCYFLLVFPLGAISAISHVLTLRERRKSESREILLGWGASLGTFGGGGAKKNMSTILAIKTIIFAWKVKFLFYSLLKYKKWQIWGAIAKWAIIATVPGAIIIMLPPFPVLLNCCSRIAQGFLRGEDWNVLCEKLKLFIPWFSGKTYL